MLKPRGFEQSEAIRTVESGFAGRRDRTARERVLLGGTTADASTRLNAFLPIKPDWDILVSGAQCCNKRDCGAILKEEAARNCSSNNVASEFKPISLSVKGETFPWFTRVLEAAPNKVQTKQTLQVLAFPRRLDDVGDLSNTSIEPSHLRVDFISFVYQ